MNNTIRIAIADDHAMFREGLVSMLNSFAHIKVIIQAGDGRELLEQLSNADALPHICILDVQMRPMNGFETAQAIKKQFPAVKTIALSMYHDEFNIISMLRSGVLGFFSKADDPTLLVHMLEQIHNKGFYYEGMDPGMITKAMQGDCTSFSDLTKTELELIPLLCGDLSSNEIAQKMNISPRSLETYRMKLFKKLDVQTRPGLVAFAMLTGLGPDKLAVV